MSGVLDSGSRYVPRACVSCVVAALLLLVLPLLAAAQFTCITNNGAITITGYTGPVGNVNIPDTINGLPVTSIGDNAFAGDWDVRGVTIPGSVTNMGYRAFADCIKLDYVTILNGITSIGDRAFENCYRLRNLVIPDSVTSIGDTAFGYCTGLVGVTIPSSVNHIPSSAFRSCSGLGTVTIPSSVSSIGEYAFVQCSGLTNLTIPNSITAIGGGAFAYCSGLTSMAIPNSITDIAYNTFGHCSSLTNVTIPSSITSIRNGAFIACTNLITLIIPDSIIIIESAAFGYCSNLRSVYFQGYVSYIDPYAFLADYNATFYYPPRIIAQPQGQTIALQTTAHLTVTVTGTLPLFYQWQFNGTDLHGATNSTLTLQNALLANSGVYGVTVTNAYGAVISDPAVLTVLPLVITTPTMLSSGQFRFSFDSATSVDYLVQYSTDLVEWIPWVTLGGNGARLTLVDPNTANSLKRFYRISLSPQ